MFENTCKKLREAEFFYAALVSEEGKILKVHGEVGDFYLSAFLSAARSVTFCFQRSIATITRRTLNRGWETCPRSTSGSCVFTTSSAGRAFICWVPTWKQ